MPLTVPQILTIAKVSQYLSAVDVQKGSLFGPRITPDTPKVLYMERMAVEWLYNLDPTDSSLTLTANYLYSLCRGYNLQAKNITGGGGSISPITPITAPTPYDFEVSASSFIPTGGTSKQFPSTWIGLDIIFVRNSIPQSTVVNALITYYSWDSTTATLNLFGPAPANGAAQATELFQIYPV